MAGGPDLRTWILGMARDLVDHGDAVSVEQFEEDGILVFELTVDPDELGRVIGRQGRTVQAMRSLLAAAGERHGRDYELEIVE